MASRRVALAASSLFAMGLALLGAAYANEAAPTEYEVRLAAHRRELLRREADLEAARVEIRDLKKRVEARSRAFQPTIAASVSHAAALYVEPSTFSDLSPPSPLPSPQIDAAPEPDEATAIVIASLQRDLDVERENRSTVEQELRRLSAESFPTQSLENLRRSVESSNAEILVLGQRAVDERHARESAEVELERVRSLAGIPRSESWLDRFEAAMKERQEQAMRLEEQLRDANEAIVALKARLESAPAEPVDLAELRALEEENAKLRAALGATEQANADLRARADLAAHLAEMLYGGSH